MTCNTDTPKIPTDTTEITTKSATVSDKNTTVAAKQTTVSETVNQNGIIRNSEFFTATHFANKSMSVQDDYEAFYNSFTRDTKSTNALLEKYDNTKLKKSVDLVYEDILPFAKLLPERYPNIIERFANTPARFTNTEMVSFLDEYAFDSTETFDTETKKQKSTCASFLEAYLKGSQISSALNILCSLPSNPIRKIMDLFENGISGIDTKLKSFVEAIKKSIDDIVEDIKAKIENTVKSFNKKIDNIRTDLRKLTRQNFAGMMKEMYVDAKNELADINIKNMKDRIEKTVVEMISVFNKKKGEQNIIDYVLSMVCKLTGNITEVLSTPMNSIKAFSDNIEGSISKLDTASSDTTKAAVEAGRKVPTPETIKARCGEYRKERKASIDAQIDDGTYDPKHHGRAKSYTGPSELPHWNEWSNLKFRTNITNDKRCDLYGLARDIGYWETNLEGFILLNGIAKDMGRTFTFTSCYRHPKINKHVGGKSGSLHLKGLAYDVVCPLSIRKEFVSRCVAAGFDGIGLYRSQGFVHVDLRGYRARWGS